MASTQSNNSFNVKQYEKECSNIITFILNNAANKLPIMGRDLNDLANKKPKLFLNLLPHITTLLLETYGIVFELLPDQKSGKKYICYMESTVASVEQLNEDQKRQICLLVIVLSYIFMSGGTVYEAKLEQFLKGLRINLDETHNYFGNVKKLLTDTFIKQLYLTRTKSESELDTEIKYTYCWGYRASKEFKKKDILEIMGNILGKPPQFFLTQYQEACDEEEQEENEIQQNEELH